MLKPPIVLALVLTLALWIIISLSPLSVKEYIPSTQQITLTNVGLLGDGIGGIVGTIISVIGILYVVKTLNSQKDTSDRQSFENHVFEMIKFHRENIAEIGIGDDYGRKIFVVMIREFRCILKITKEAMGSVNKSQETLNQRDVFSIAYICFYFGAGPNSDRITRSYLRKTKAHQELIDELIKQLNSPNKRSQTKEDRGFKFTPFEGHQSRLAHYYRHIYNTVNYIDKGRRINDKEKYHYAKLFRSQLTNHEQVMLFINSLSPLGAPFKDGGDCECLLNKYKLVKNIPLDFFDREQEIDLNSEFPRSYFEWEDTILTPSAPTPP